MVRHLPQRPLVLAFIVTALSISSCQPRPAQAYNPEVYTNDPERVAILTILMEAYGEGTKGMTAVGEVIRTRARERSLSWAEVCLQPKQFSCWNGMKRENILSTFDYHRHGYRLEHYEKAKIAWEKSAFTNYTKGANLYYAPKLASPSWAKKTPLVAVIGNHNFHREKR